MSVAAIDNICRIFVYVSAVSGHLLVSSSATLIVPISDETVSPFEFVISLLAVPVNALG